MRALIVASLLVSAACSLSPDVSKYEPKTAADCPGQKACGWRCVDFDDPAAGCTLNGCKPCPVGAPNTVAICGVANTCASTCAAGFADCDGDPATGCERSVSSDAANCGACGRTCATACVAGECQVAPTTLVAASGEQPRGIAVAGTDVVWANDPPVAGGADPIGALHRTPLDGGAVVDTPGLGHASWVRSAGGRPVLVAGTEVFYPGGTSYAASWLDDPARSLLQIEGGMDGVMGGVALGASTAFSVVVPSLQVIWSPTDGTCCGGVIYYDEPLFTIAQGAGDFWVGATGGVYRIGEYGGSPGRISGGGTYFSGLTSPPRPDRVAARAEPTGDVRVVYFADLRDGSIWTGRTTGAGNNPWRLVRGDGARSQMDVAADDLGAVWSDYDRSEIWAATATGQIYKVASGVKPWAIAITADTVYFTDVDAQEIRSVPR